MKTNMQIGTVENHEVTVRCEECGKFHLGVTVASIKRVSNNYYYIDADDALMSWFLFGHCNNLEGKVLAVHKDNIKFLK